MKKSFKVVLLGLSSAVFATGCVNIVVQKDPRTELVEVSQNKDDSEVVVTAEIEVPDEVVEGEKVPEEDSAVIAEAPAPAEEVKEEAPKAEEEEVVEAIAEAEEAPKDGYLKFDSDKISTIPVFMDGGSFSFSIRNELKSGALLSSDSDLQISGMKTDLEGLSCDKLVDEKKVFYGLTCTYEALKGEIGQQFKMLVIARNGAGYEVEDYALFELRKASLEVKSEAVIKVASGESVTLNPSQWKKDGILSSSDDLLYIGKLGIDGFNETQKHMDESGQYVISMDGVLNSDKVGSEFTGVAVVGDSAKNYVEVKVIIQVVEAEKSDSSSAFVIDEKVDSKEVQELKKNAQAETAEISAKIDYVASIEVKSEEEQKKIDEELASLRGLLADVQAKHLQALADQQAKEKAAQEWVVDETLDSKEVIELKNRMNSVIAEINKAKENAANDYKDEELAKVLAELDAKVESSAKEIQARIAEIKAEEEKAAGSEEAPAEEAKAEEETQANNHAYTEALALQAANPGSKIVGALRGMNPCPYTGILDSVEPTAKSIQIIGCPNTQVANPTGDINSGWMGYFVYNVTY